MSSRGVISILIGLLVITGGIYVVLTRRQQSDNKINTSTTTVSSDTPLPENSTVFSSPPGSTAYTGKILAGTTTLYLEFTQADYEKALQEGKIIFLDFYANWCPICKAESPDIIAGFNQLSYSNVVGFRVNYNDNETDDFEKKLAKQFGIAYQHTKVILKNGKRVLKSPEVWDTKRLIDEVGKVVTN